MPDWHLLRIPVAPFKERFYYLSASLRTVWLQFDQIWLTVTKQGTNHQQTLIQLLLNQDWCTRCDITSCHPTPDISTLSTLKFLIQQNKSKIKLIQTDIFDTLYPFVRETEDPQHPQQADFYYSYYDQMLSHGINSILLRHGSHTHFSHNIPSFSSLFSLNYSFTCGDSTIAAVRLWPTLNSCRILWSMNLTFLKYHNASVWFCSA